MCMTPSVQMGEGKAYICGFKYNMLARYTRTHVLHNSKHMWGVKPQQYVTICLCKIWQLHIYAHTDIDREEFSRLLLELVPLAPFVSGFVHVPAQGRTWVCLILTNRYLKGVQWVVTLLWRRHKEGCRGFTLIMWCFVICFIWSFAEFKVELALIKGD